MDIFEPKVRSYIMSRIKGKNTKPEVFVRKYLFANGFRFRLHVKSLPGTPDIVLPKHKTVIFVHGCFWHAHEGCKDFKPPTTRPEFWAEKFRKNRERDEKHRQQLQALGWKVIVVWQCGLKPSIAEDTLSDLVLDIYRKTKL